MSLTIIPGFPRRSIRASVRVAPSWTWGRNAWNRDIATSRSAPEKSARLSVAGWGFSQVLKWLLFINKKFVERDNCLSPLELLLLVQLHIVLQIDADDGYLFHGCPLLQLVFRQHEFGTSRCRLGRAASTPSPVLSPWVFHPVTGALGPCIASDTPPVGSHSPWQKRG